MKLGSNLYKWPKMALQKCKFCRRNQKIGGKAFVRNPKHSGVVEMCNLRGTTGVQLNRHSTRGIKVPKEAVFIRVKGELYGIFFFNGNPLGAALSQFLN